MPIPPCTNVLKMTCRWHVVQWVESRFATLPYHAGGPGWVPAILCQFSSLLFVSEITFTIQVLQWQQRSPGPTEAITARGVDSPAFRNPSITHNCVVLTKSQVSPFVPTTYRKGELRSNDIPQTVPRNKLFALRCQSARVQISLIPKSLCFVSTVCLRRSTISVNSSLHFKFAPLKQNKLSFSKVVCNHLKY